MIPSVARGLVPPRPNLGPEPWRQPPSLTGALVVSGLLALLLLALWLGRRRRRRSRADADPRTRGDSLPPEPSPRDRLVALAGLVRDALILQFGPGFRAKTTEELAADDRLAERLPPEDLHDLIRFLDQIDRLKFAPERSENHEPALQEALASWKPRIEALEASIRNKPGDRVQAKTARPRSRDSRNPTATDGAGVRR